MNRFKRKKDYLGKLSRRHFGTTEDLKFAISWGFINMPLTSPINFRAISLEPVL